MVAQRDIAIVAIAEPYTHTFVRMSDDRAVLLRQLEVCELKEQRLLRAVQLATSSRDHETVQLDQCKQQLVEAEQSTAEDMLDLCLL